MAEQGDRPVADETGGGVMPGDGELEDRGQHLLLVQRIALVTCPDEVGDQVLARLGALAVEQVGQVPHDVRRGRDRARRRFGRGGGRQERGEPGAELGPVLLGDAQQLADHGEGQWEGEACDQVDDGVAAAVQLVEQVVDERLDARPQRGDPWSAERGRGQPAQPGVVGRVDAEHVPGEGGAGQALGDHGAVAGERGVHVLGKPRLVERGPCLGVADDEPGSLAVGQCDLVHRPGGADPREQRERVVAVEAAPRVERRITHCRPPCR
jgi:hypothetical protein